MTTCFTALRCQAIYTPESMLKCCRDGSERGPVALPVFKTGLLPAIAGRLGSTPRRFRHPSCSVAPHMKETSRRAGPRAAGSPSFWTNHCCCWQGRGGSGVGQRRLRMKPRWERCSASSRAAGSRPLADDKPESRLERRAVAREPRDAPRTRGYRHGRCSSALMERLLRPVF